MKKILLSFVFVFSLLVVGFGQDAPLESYVGRYVFPAGNQVPYVDVKLVDGNLFSESPNGVANLKRSEGDLFIIVEYEGLAEFIRNEDKKVVKVKVFVMGIEMEGTKEETPAISRKFWHLLQPLRF